MNMNSHERLIDEMAVTLCGVMELGSDQECIVALMMADFPAVAIHLHLDEARELARKARAGEADLWHQVRTA
jgi:hypothetical protein